MVYPFPRPFPGPSILKSFTVLSLFSSGEQGAWYDPSDFSTMFQDSAGTTPVTAVEQPVGLLLDKSKGLVLGAELVTNGTFDTNTTGWTSWQTGTLSVDTSRLKIENGAATISGAYQLITVVVGRTYKFEGVKEPGTAAAPRYYLGTSIGGTQYATNATSGQVFLATSTTLVVTAATQSTVLGATAFFDNISVKELAGNHASQSTAASRPVLSARVNLLTYSEQFDNAAWVNFQTSDAGNTTTAPDGTTTADTLTATAGTNSRYIYQIAPAVVSGAGYTVSFSAKAGTHGAVQFCSSDGFGVAGYVNFNLSTGAIGTSSIYTGSISSQGNGWYRCTVTLTATSAAASNLVICMVADASATRAASWTAAGTETIFLWGADLRVTNVGVNLPAYQRVAAATDYDTSGFPLYLKFDGVDDSLSTGSIDFSSTDKMSVFAGVRKLSDAATGMILELSSSLNGNPGTFYFLGPYSNGQTNYNFSSKGTLFAEATGAGFVAPITSVLTGTGDIIGDLVRLRSNGTQVASSVADQGAGNYGNYPLYIGRRGGSTLPYNGHLYSLIVRGALSTDAQIASTETYVNSKTGAY